MPFHFCAYRSEIDGLRALAVLSVIFYHLQVPAFSGGFAGVDIFFVISGHLIASLLYQERCENRLNWALFAERRIRRLLPALIAVIAATLLLGHLWMLPGQRQDLWQSALTSAFFVSNYYWETQRAYFAIGADFQPLLHTWSLGVEAQFYLLAPLVVWAFVRRSRYLALAIILGAAAASFLLVLEASPLDQRAQFFLPYARFWEFLAGVLVALLRLRFDIRQNGVVALMGLVLIGYGLYLLDGDTNARGVQTLMPVVGTASVLLFAGSGDRVGRLVVGTLSMRPLVWIGLLSYSAYLWHQPIIAFARIGIPGAEERAMLPVILAVTLLLAALSYYLIERPTRAPTGFFSTRQRFAQLAAAGFGVVLAGSALTATSLGMEEFDANPSLRSAAMFDAAIEEARADRVAVENEPLAQHYARFQSEGAGTHRVLIFGDSHSRDLLNMMELNRELFPGFEFRRRQNSSIAVNMECTAAEAVAGGCVDFVNPDVAALVDSATHIVVTSLWSSQRQWPRYLPVLVRHMQGRGKSVSVVLNAPDFAPFPSWLIVDLYRKGDLTTTTAAERLFTAIRPRVARINAELSQVARELGAHVLDRGTIACDAVRRMCHAFTPEGEGIYFDGHHLTVEGARYMGRLAAQQDWLAPLLEARDDGHANALPHAWDDRRAGFR